MFPGKLNKVWVMRNSLSPEMATVPVLISPNFRTLSRSAVLRLPTCAMAHSSEMPTGLTFPCVCILACDLPAFACFETDRRMFSDVDSMPRLGFTLAGTIITR